MQLSAAQWLMAFVVAVAVHLLAGVLLWTFANAPQTPPHSPRGVMVSLDALTTGNTPQPMNTPQPVPAKPATPAEHATATTHPEPVPASPPTPTIPASAVTPEPVTPTPVQPQPVQTHGARQDNNGVDIPVASPVTIDSADTVKATAATTRVPITTPQAPTPGQQGHGAHGVSSDPTVTYIAHIRSWLGQHKYYPTAARRSGKQGIVRLYLVVARDGRVLSLAIAHSSGHSVLDQAALNMVKRAEPLPTMPDDLMRTRIEIILPVHYSLSIEPGSATK